MLESYVDDFCAMVQTKDRQALLQVSRSLLHAIHSVYPPPAVTGHTGGDPVSLKKLKAGRGRVGREEGDPRLGVRRGAPLHRAPAEQGGKDHRGVEGSHSPRVDSLQAVRKIGGKAATRSHRPTGGKRVNDTLQRRDTRATITGQPRAGWGRLSSAFRDWIYLINEVSKRPTHVRELALCSELPDDVLYHDAANEGVGGVWFALDDLYPPTVFRFEWPDTVRREVVSWENPKGTITNSDLETAGQLVGQLVREQLGPMQHRQIAAFGDNTPTVARGRKMATIQLQGGRQVTSRTGNAPAGNTGGTVLVEHVAGEDE